MTGATSAAARTRTPPRAAAPPPTRGRRRRFDCHGCNATLGCCLVYETCVACCLDPAHTALDFALKAMRAKQPSAGTYQSVFEYCRGQCRHNSQSVIHENAYARPDHHCFRPLEIKADDAAANEDELVDVSVVVASQGQSCDLACLTVGRQCGLTQLAVLNKCSVMQKHFDCRGSCIQSLGNDQPAEVVAGAPRHLFPGACMLNSKEAYFSCQGFHPNTRRLCPCAKRENHTAREDLIGWKEQAAQEIIVTRGQPCLQVKDGGNS
eukprot:SM000159S01789  [mRNA]  locus=s159:260458:265057:+ [translate_table: standard]